MKSLRDRLAEREEKKEKRPSSVKRESIPDDVIQNAIENANESRVTRMWKRPRHLVRAARLWEQSFGVIDMRELNLISCWTAYQNVMECLPPEAIVAYSTWVRHIVKKIMLPVGHAYSVRYIELSRMDTMALSKFAGERSSFIVVNSQCLPLYAWYMNDRMAENGNWKRSPHTVENFMRSISSATLEEIDKIFSVRYDHMWLSRFPKDYYKYVWTWNGRVWDGKGKPRDVTLATVYPSVRGISYEESFIREKHKSVDEAFARDEEEDGDENENESEGV